VVPDRSRPLPLWAQVCDDLRRRIAAGEFESGFPGELSLVDQYEVSRHTIREALRVLRGEGLVRSERGRSSRVEPTVAQNLGSLYSLFHTLTEQGFTQRSVVRRQAVTSNATVAQRLSVQPDADLVVIERLRFADDTALALDTAWLPASLALPLIDVDFTHQGLYETLAKVCAIHVDSGREHIAAVPSPAHIAALLGLSPHSPTYHIERLTCAGDRAVEWRETFIRGDRFNLEVDWSRGEYSISTSTGLVESGDM
jgi:GntR family transcriptional regulator